jgi:hypothetical protein
MITVGRALKNEDGAGAIVMGCAGMARHRKPLEDALGIPVIDPTRPPSPWRSARCSLQLDSSGRNRAGAARDQAVILNAAVAREVEDRLLAEHRVVEITGVN